MKKFLFLATALVLTIPAFDARADVIALDGATVIDDGKIIQSDPHAAFTINDGRELRIYNRRHRDADRAYIIQDGKMQALDDGSYVLNNGQTLNIKKGRIEHYGSVDNGRVIFREGP